MLPPEFQWLRTPEPERLFKLSGQALRLFGRESVGSWFEQCLVARRQEDHAFRVETQLQFEPQNYQQAAGLSHYYTRHKFHVPGRGLTILSCPATGPIAGCRFL